uniref:Odorant-binding protein 6 n=1 Tax=Cnaphalocrocis medinalis TaxID=437488 RepID=A0A0U3C2E7_CNAME|nr:odorant-binding protein 6 [Cnaphalocrocis medinalis]
MGSPSFSAMWAVVLLALLPALVKCSGEGNIRLLEEEVANAMNACVQPADKKEAAPPQRQRRSEDYPRIDNNDSSSQNMYSHERRNTSDLQDTYVLNGSDYDWGYGDNRQARDRNSSEVYGNRTKRSEPLLNKPDSDQCLSQCIFANLQVVDSRGIPREAELWNKVQSSVTSQQSRAALRDQIRACFQELQSEAEDNGCSYSNKLERCLMLRFSDRKNDSGAAQTQSGGQKT